MKKAALLTAILLLIPIATHTAGRPVTQKEARTRAATYSSNRTKNKKSRFTQRRVNVHLDDQPGEMYYDEEEANQGRQQQAQPAIHNASRTVILSAADHDHIEIAPAPSPIATVPSSPGIHNPSSAIDLASLAAAAAMPEEEEKEREAQAHNNESTHQPFDLDASLIRDLVEEIIQGAATNYAHEQAQQSLGAKISYPGEEEEKEEEEEKYGHEKNHSPIHIKTRESIATFRNLIEAHEENADPETITDLERAASNSIADIVGLIVQDIPVTDDTSEELYALTLDDVEPLDQLLDAFQSNADQKVLADLKSTASPSVAAIFDLVTQNPESPVQKKKQGPNRPAPLDIPTDDGEKAPDTFTTSSDRSRDSYSKKRKLFNTPEQSPHSSPLSKRAKTPDTPISNRSDNAVLDTPTHTTPTSNTSNHYSPLTEFDSDSPARSNASPANAPNAPSPRIPRRFTPIQTPPKNLETPLSPLTPQESAVVQQLPENCLNYELVRAKLLQLANNAPTPCATPFATPLASAINSPRLTPAPRSPAHQSQPTQSPPSPLPQTPPISTPRRQNSAPVPQIPSVPVVHLSSPAISEPKTPVPARSLASIPPTEPAPAIQVTAPVTCVPLVATHNTSVTPSTQKQPAALKKHTPQPKRRKARPMPSRPVKAKSAKPPVTKPILTQQKPIPAQPPVVTTNTDIEDDWELIDTPIEKPETNEPHQHQPEIETEHDNAQWTSEQKSSIVAIAIGIVCTIYHKHVTSAWKRLMKLCGYGKQKPRPKPTTHNTLCT